MKHTKLMIITYLIIAILLFLFSCMSSCVPLNGDLLVVALYGPYTPVLILILSAIVEKQRIKHNDITEQKAFKIAIILSNILFLLFYFVWFFIWAFMQLLSEPIE